MRQQKHTPGPWEVDDSTEYKLTIVAPWNEKVKPEKDSGYGDYRGLHVCYIEHQNDNPCVSKKQAQSNANLIALAPTLLENCRGMLQCICDYNEGKDQEVNGWIREWQKIIFQAEGKCYEAKEV